MGNLSIGRILSHLGYKSQFIYGGDSYFDNMGDFFSHNGYEVIDRKDIPNNQVTFANIWGVCDEDIFNKSLQVFDKTISRSFLSSSTDYDHEQSSPLHLSQWQN